MENEREEFGLVHQFESSVFYRALRVITVEPQSTVSGLSHPVSYTHRRPVRPQVSGQRSPLPIPNAAFGNSDAEMVF